jgi:hypothetical protein
MVLSLCGVVALILKGNPGPVTLLKGSRRSHLGTTDMVKKKVVAPTLYVHQAAAVVHRNISTTADGRRLRNDTNLVNLPPVPISRPERFIPLLEPIQNAPYAFDDAHIPINPENPDDLTGVKVKVTASKRYQNSVCVS